MNILEEKKSDTKNFVRQNPIKISVKDIKKLEITPGNFLNNVKAELEHDGLVWKSVEVEAETEEVLEQAAESDEVSEEVSEEEVEV